MTDPIHENRFCKMEHTADAFHDLLAHNLFHVHGEALHTAGMHDAYMVLSYTVRDYLIERALKAVHTRYDANPKYVYYLSAEYLLGKQLPQNLLYSDTTEIAREALARHNVKLEDLIELDVEPGLGNGGLGRLAACFIESLATLDVPAVGYGIRYEFGIFDQVFQDGWQVEKPDGWARWGNPWEFPRPDHVVEVGFGGSTQRYTDTQGIDRVRWIPEHKVLGEPCSSMVPGYATQNVNFLRLWRARATDEFDFELFHDGDYAKAVQQKVYSENISKVLYPNDETIEGKQLRLQQQYFFVACSLRDIIQRFHLKNDNWDEFPNKVVIQLNDTHPVVAIPELIRLLIDEYLLDWDRAWRITQATFAYTCHTLLPEALETWPVELFESLLPRHMEIVYEINQRFLNEVRRQYPRDEERIQRMSIIQEHPARSVRMAHLATVGTFAVNGVAELHSQLLRERTLHDFAEVWPEKFQNKTNGVTPRRFMRMSNPRLSELITSRIGDQWLTDLDQLRGLEDSVDDMDFRQQWREVKQQNKVDLAKLMLERTGVKLDTASIFDIMVKRLHEYKRQVLKVMHIVWLYQRFKANPSAPIVPRSFVFGAKAAPGYFMAKQIIKLIHSVAEVVNQDPDIDGRLRVVFPENFNVSLAEVIYPSADISEQISMAGKEASGTGNMKFALNGALTVGTLDGANIEIRDRVGEENFFLFGLDAKAVFETKRNGYNPRAVYESDEDLRRIIDSISSGEFSRGDAQLFRPIVDSLLDHDTYLVLEDFKDYVNCCERAAAAYQNQDHWTKMSILNTARCGFFSSDRTIRQYCDEIWKVHPVPIT